MDRVESFCMYWFEKLSNMSNAVMLRMRCLIILINTGITHRHICSQNHNDIRYKYVHINTDVAA